MIIKDEWETMRKVTIVVFMKMSFVVQLLRLVELRIFTTNISQDKKKKIASGPDSNTENLKHKTAKCHVLCTDTRCETRFRPLAGKFCNGILFFSWYVIILT